MTGYLTPHMTRFMIAVSDHREVEIGVEWGRALATALHLPLTFVTVVEDVHETATKQQQQTMAHDLLEIVTSDMRLRGFDVDFKVMVGDSAERLSHLAASEPGTLLILPVDHTGGHQLLDSKSKLGRILIRMTTGYMLIPSQARPHGRIHSVVVGVDQSPLSTEVLRTARGLAAGLDVDVISVEAVEPDAVPEEEFFGSKLQLGRRSVRARGFASQVILATARARDAAVIVVGSHGVGTSPSAVMGRTADWLSINADRPVVIMPRDRS